MKLTQAERLSLWNQYEILKHVNPDDIKEYERNQEILSNGFELYYSELNPSIYESGVDEATCREVQEILNVFRAITFSCDRLKYTPKSYHAQFEGFDGNGSTGHYGFAQFLRRTLGLWDELADRPDNSHSSTSLNHYRAMVRAWDRLGGNYELDAAEIEQIADAR
ncbi:YfbU family protein [Sphingomonas oleivorans]|nr:YfbU family protein [Sphingomonas oleivorans]